MNILHLTVYLTVFSCIASPAADELWNRFAKDEEKPRYLMKSSTYRQSEKLGRIQGADKSMPTVRYQGGRSGWYKSDWNYSFVMTVPFQEAGVDKQAVVEWNQERDLDAGSGKLSVSLAIDKDPLCLWAIQHKIGQKKNTCTSNVFSYFTSYAITPRFLSFEPKGRNNLAFQIIPYGPVELRIFEKRNIHLRESRSVDSATLVLLEEEEVLHFKKSRCWSSLPLDGRTSSPPYADIRAVENAWKGIDHKVSTAGSSRGPTFYMFEAINWRNKPDDYYSVCAKHYESEDFICYPSAPELKINSKPAYEVAEEYTSVRLNLQPERSLHKEYSHVTYLKATIIALPVGLLDIGGNIINCSKNNVYYFKNQKLLKPGDLETCFDIYNLETDAVNNFATKVSERLKL